MGIQCLTPRDIEVPSGSLCMDQHFWRCIVEMDSNLVGVGRRNLSNVCWKLLCLRLWGNGTPCPGSTLESVKMPPVPCSLRAVSLLLCSNFDFTRDTVPSTDLTELCQEVVCVALPPSDTLQILTKQTPFLQDQCLLFPNWCSRGHMPVSSCKRGW